MSDRKPSGGPPGPTTEVPPGGRIARVLVVDDDDAVRLAYRRMLSAEGHEVVEAACASAALDRLGSMAFDAVLADILMPEMNGVELLRIVRQIDPELMVLLVTGSPSIETASEAIALRAFRYLTKPLGMDELQRHIREAIAATRSARLERVAITEVAYTHRKTSELTLSFEHALATLTLAYQPIITWQARRAMGYEALVRSSEAKLPRPEALFDAAERLGRLDEVGRAIRARAASEVQALHAQSRLFVNLHPADLLDEQLYDDKAPLSQHAGRIVLEITERASLQGVDDLEERMDRLRKLGFRLAVDDLGAGYAALTSFAMLKPEVVKLDMALVRGIDAQPTQQKVVRAMVSLCHELGTEVVSEGVETTAERDALLTLGSDFLQGYLFGKPTPPFATPQFE